MLGIITAILKIAPAMIPKISPRMRGMISSFYSDRSESSASKAKQPSIHLGWQISIFPWIVVKRRSCRALRQFVGSHLFGKFDCCVDHLGAGGDFQVTVTGEPG